MDITLPFEWTIKRVKLADLIEFDHNPRILTEKQYHLLMGSLKKFGLSEKPVINQDMTIISGHQRLRTLADLGFTEVDVMYPDKLLTPEQAKEKNIQMNSVSGEWCHETLGNFYDPGYLLDCGLTEEMLGLEKPPPPKKKVKPVITFEFADKDTMVEYITTCERLAEEAQAKMKVRG